MEEVITNLATNGGPMGVIAAGVVYLIIYIQRKQTSEKRNDDTIKLKEQIDEIKEDLNKEKTEKQLIQKDVAYLLTETTGIKEDIKEMKNTLNSMALSLERIASKYEDKQG